MLWEWSQRLGLILKQFQHEILYWEVEFHKKRGYDRETTLCVNNLILVLWLVLMNILIVFEE